MKNTISLFFLLLAAAACSEGEPPVVSDLRITTSPVVRGQAANGSLTVSDIDGLRGLEIDARMEGPINGPVSFSEPSFSDTDTEAPVAFALLLPTQAPAGAYTLIVEATDIDGMVSDEATVDLEVQ